MKMFYAIAVAFAAFMAADCGGEENPTRTEEIEEGSTPSETDDDVAELPACITAGGTCDDHVVAIPPDTEVQPDPIDDQEPTEDEDPPPVATDDCADFPWLKDATGKQYQCGAQPCSLELPKESDGVCAAKCDPAFYLEADRLTHLDGIEFIYTDSGGTYTCSPLN